MNLNTYLTRQFKNLNGVFHGIVGDISPEEWLSRSAAGQNTLGYTAWHCPRIQDHFLNRWIQNRPEIVEDQRWQHWAPLKPLGVGVGISLAESDLIARSATPADTLAYADEVHQAMLAWLANINEDQLEFAPNARKHVQLFAEYQTTGYLEEVGDLFGLPVWGLLMRPCMGHIHRHLGEIEITKDLLRKSI